MITMIKFHSILSKEERSARYYPSNLYRGMPFWGIRTDNSSCSIRPTPKQGEYLYYSRGDSYSYGRIYE